MFLDYFGLIEQPFGVTPDPRFLQMGAKHREALASLMYGMDCNRGFLALIAEPGMGKTSLLYQLMEGLREKREPLSFSRRIAILGICCAKFLVIWAWTMPAKPCRRCKRC